MSCLPLRHITDKSVGIRVGVCAAHFVHPQVMKPPSAHAEMCELILQKAKKWI